MKLIKISLERIKQAVLYSIVVLIFFNLLYTLFFFSKTYEDVRVNTTIKVNNQTQVWYVYKNKYSEERFFSESISITPNKTESFSYTIASNKELDYIGLFWNAEKGSSIRLESYQQTISDKTYKSTENRKIIQYVNEGCIINTDVDGALITSTESKRNWIALNDTSGLNDKRDFKKHRPIPMVFNMLLFVIIGICSLLFLHKFKCPIIKIKSIDIEEIKTFFFFLWAFIMPFWIVFSHTLMSVIVLLTLFQAYKQNKRKELLQDYKIHLGFLFFFIWVLIATFFSSSVKQFSDVLLDYSYFLLIPIVFSLISQSTLKKALHYFEKGILIYFLLLLIYTTNNFVNLSPDYSFFKFLELTTELFWHTSYLSALLLIVFIKRIKEPIHNSALQILFHGLALLFMFVVHARFPFIIGLLLVMYKIVRSIKTKWIKTTLNIGAIAAAIVLLVAFLLNSFQKETKSVDNYNDIGTIDARLSLWQASWMQIKAHPIFGVGQSNTVDAISNSISNNLSTKFRNFNAHNQFVETFLSFGSVGFIIFISFFFLMFRKGNIYQRGFVISIFTLFLVESYLQRQAGIVFFTFWYCFFLIYNPSPCLHED